MTGSETTRQRRRGSGFTLIELVVAFAILALLAATAPAALGKLHETMEYRATVRQMLAGLKDARTTAARTGQNVPFAIDLAERTFGIDGAPGEHIPEGLDIRVVLAEREMSATERRGMIRFYPDGGATGGTIELRRVSGEGVRLRVDWLLGRVSQEIVKAP